MAKRYNQIIHVSTQDKEKFRKQCREEFLRHHREIDESQLTDGFMFHKIVNYYLGE